MMSKNKFFTITKEQYRKFTRNKIELLFKVQCTEKKKGKRRFKIFQQVEDKPKPPVKIIEKESKGPEEPKDPGIKNGPKGPGGPKGPKKPPVPDDPDTPDVPKGPKEPGGSKGPGGPDDPNGGKKKVPKPDKYVTHRELDEKLTEFHDKLMVELDGKFATKADLKRVEDKVDVLFELQKTQDEQIKVQGKQI
ncbi:hypothetical protein MPTA7396_1120 [Mycoplasmoides pneumoniae]|nr:hypothetical protein KPI25BX_6490 [Mycoplasmoides pneumoniae]GLL59274.1 hypothetical protein Y12242BV_6000 [Mycoplasmoides pneumoniae]GLL59435.1 hypothetical protein Y12382J_0410 [Mycoplasmoides pneumoniae]